MVEFATEEGFNFREDAAATAARTLWIQIGGSLLALAIGIVIAVLPARFQAQPLNAISTRMVDLTKGDF
ncbi:MAG: hypothetical protein QF491_04360, partial [Alphaproteobacteria bacterium]|nr:hypothetical protein [Alphaproteobacteria bacterium]